MEIMPGIEKVLATSKPSQHVFGSFNGRIENVLVVFLNELSQKEQLGAEGQLNELVTDPQMIINKKGVESYSITSRHRFAGFTNNENPKKTAEKSRRDFVIKCDSSIAHQPSYFGPLRSAMTTNAIKGIYENLKKVECNNLGSLPIPQTKYHAELIEANRDTVDDWFREFVADFNQQCASDDDGSESEMETWAEEGLRRRELFGLYNKYGARSKVNFQLTEQKFGLKFTNLLSNIPNWGTIKKVHNVKRWKLM